MATHPDPHTQVSIAQEAAKYLTARLSEEEFAIRVLKLRENAGGAPEEIKPVPTRVARSSSRRMATKQSEAGEARSDQPRVWINMDL